MKKFLRALLSMLLLLPALSHCAPYSEVDRLQNQLRTMNRRMEEMKSAQREQAASSEQNSQLAQQAQDLRNQLDDANQANSRLKEQNKSLESAANARSQESGKRNEAINKMEESLRAKDEKIAALEEKLKAQHDNLKLVQSQRIGDTEKALKEAQSKAEAARAKAKALSTSTGAGEVKKISSGQTKIVTPKPAAAERKDKEQAAPTDDDPFDKIPANSPAPAKAPAPAKVNATPAEQTAKPVAEQAAKPATNSDKLAEGKRLYDQKQYAKARTVYESYLTSKPSASQAAEADYMIGECNYQSKQYDLAIISYQKVVSNPGHGKAAAATLKQGMAFEQMADLEMAKTIYKKLIDQHPNSPEAKTAQERLGKL